MSSTTEQWTMPEWMRPFSEHFADTGRLIEGPQTIEDMCNGNADARINLPLAVLEACVLAQVLP